MRTMLIWLVLATGLAGAQPGRITTTFDVFPARAVVSIQQDVYPVQRPVQVSLPGPDVELVLQARGFATSRIHVTKDDLQGTWPAAGRYYMQPASLWALTALPAWTPLVLLGLVALVLKRRPQPAAPMPVGLAPWQLQPGMRVFDYRVLELLGEGGSGIVYKVRNPQGDELALKLLKLQPGQQTEDHARFRREMKVLRRINHPNIPFLADYGEFNGLDYLVMELLGQTTLKEKLPLLPGRTVKVLLQLASALEFCHNEGILHRDIKPENVIWSEGRVRLTDFGLARHRDSTMVTQEGAVMGTPDYMAPEVIRGETFTPLSDQYSLGCLAYHMLRGQPPFLGKTPIAVLMQHLENEPPPLTGVPERLNRLIFRMLKKDPAARFADMGEVQQHLKEL